MAKKREENQNTSDTARKNDLTYFVLSRNHQLAMAFQVGFKEEMDTSKLMDAAVQKDSENHKSPKNGTSTGWFVTR